MSRVDAAAVSARRLDLSFDAVPVTVRKARLACVGFARHAGASEEVVDDVELCVSEAVTNVVRHAYPDADGGEVHLTARREEGGLVFVVADDGVGFRAGDPDFGPGRGLRVMDGLADDLAVVSTAEAGSSVQLRFALTR